jgi:hypothetical protein
MNKLREKIIVEIINNNEYYKIFKNTDYYRKYTNLSIKLKRQIRSFTDKSYQWLKLSLMAGRKYNYDFLCNYYNDSTIVDSVKIEFKYGIFKLTQYPEIFSKDTKSTKMFYEKDYISDFYDNIDEFIKQFPNEIQNKLNNSRPNTIQKYKKIINDTSYRHPFQQIIYNYNKIHTSNNISHKRFVNNQISDFIKSISIDDINFEHISNMIYTKQCDKVFLLIDCDGNCYSRQLANEIQMTRQMRKKNGNTLIFKTQDVDHELHFLLRWKNHKGCALPAWQVKLHINRKNKL